MNKMEKLLAARKRLKEFQLSKKHHIPYNVPNQLDDRSQETAIQQDNDMEVDDPNSNRNEVAGCPREGSQESITNSQNFEYFVPSAESNPYNDQNVIETRVEQVPTPCEFSQDSADIGSNKPAEEFNYITSFTNQQVDATKNHEPEPKPLRDDALSEQPPDQSRAQLDFQWNHESYTNEFKDSSHQETQQQEPSDNHVPLTDSPSLQKEHLLQMASAVANVLVDDLAVKEPTSELVSDLEQRNQFLASRLQEQTLLVNQLHVQISQYSSRVSELEAVIATKDAEFEGKLHREINPLKEQLQLHAQTTGILVGEKAELTAALAQSQATAKQKAGEVEDLYGKLKTLHLRVCELEKELNSVKSNSADTGKVSEQLQRDYSTLSDNFSELRKEKDDLELEASELRQKLNVKNTELMSLQQELQEKNALLSLSDLRMQQMNNSPQGVQNGEEQHHVVAALEQQLAQLMETLKSVSSEKDEASAHYQNYAQQLNTQVTTLAHQLEETTKANTEISSREHSLIQRMSDLERQLQIERERTEPPPPPPPPVDNERIAALEKSIDELVLEKDSLQLTLQEKDANIDVLKKELEEFQEMREREAEASKLASAIEGERLAAARAVSQNQQLKQQLSEMQDAFVQLSNTKLDLTEQLQAERSIGKKLNARLNDTETEGDKLKEEINTMKRALAELEKEKLHAAQITDQMQHYQAQSQHSSTLQEELRYAQDCIEKLKRENQRLTDKLNSESEVQTDQTDASVQSDETPQSEDQETTTEEENLIEKMTATTQTVMKTEEEETTITPEAVKKLEERFKNTMERLAELSDEKQRLEHLVLQLQGETETIGEYVTLYQKQRGILQERAREKEEAFRQLTEQRNQQQEQLHKLKMLVAQLITNKPDSGSVDIPPTANHNGEHEESVDKPEHIENVGNNHEALIVKDKTKSQILDLLTEIKECKDTCVLEPNFHPCPWCSGKLITV